MKLNEMKYTEGARRERKRKARGIGSGLGKTSGRGSNGQNSRSGGGVAIGFEGGQTPLYKRIPKRGFKNYNRVNYAVVNLDLLNKFDNGAVVTPEVLKESGMVKNQLDGIKVLGNGSLDKKLTVKCNKISASAKAAIEKAGGTVEVL